MKNKETNDFSKQLCSLRKSQGLTQIELGKKTGISQRMIAYYETSVPRIPKMEILKTLAEGLNCSVNQLLSTKTENPPKNPTIWKKLKKIENLNPKDQKVILTMIESLAQKEPSLSK